MNRNACMSATVDVINDRVKCARYTAYSLMGAGFHGTPGVCNQCPKKMLYTYTPLRMLYRLEAFIFCLKQKQMLEASFRQMLKRIQSLPQRTANEVPTILFGILPAETLLDIKTLIFYNIITNHGSPAIT